MKLVYIAGPMTDIEEHNHPAFEAATEKLEALGFEVISPHRFFDGDTTRPRAEYMRHGIQLLTVCDAIYMLEGWDRSPGATLERRIAGELDLIFMYEAGGGFYY